MAFPVRIQEIAIKNFKRFRYLSAVGLPQFNLLVGDNNSGKTTFLEAIFLCLGPTNPQLWINVNGRRGLDRVGEKDTTAQFLFTELDSTYPILFDVVTAQGLTYQVRIETAELPTSLLPASRSEEGQSAVTQARSETTSPAPPSALIRQTYQRQGEPPVESTVSLSASGLNVTRGSPSVFTDCVYVGHSLAPADVNAPARYSALDQRGQIPRLEAALRQMHPDLKRTSLAIHNDEPKVHADVGYGLVPLSTLGSGISRLLTLLLAIAASTDGVVLIDEIESSFHHSKLTPTWQSIAAFCSDFNVQIFATTHSLECVSSAVDVFHARADLQLALHKIVTVGEESSLRTVDRDHLETALETGWDLR